jgi:hypothetical protein
MSNNKQRTTNEKPVPHLPLKFVDAIAAALETPPERRKLPRKNTAKPKQNEGQND